ncbi:MAG: ATP-binding cassette domain-containing protein [Ruminococcaceae bacterium]|nr:ATP-binding cassette domain-containing protein [Oscillospiraceae bacterium]
MANVEKKALKLEEKNAKIRAKALEEQRTRVYNQMVAAQKRSKKQKKIAPKEAYISLQNINKIYPNKVQAVFDFNLDIKKNEFIVFVGPSGCGKSTTLRMIAGLEDITGGDLYIDNVYANDLQPKDRDIAMVFQSYALYPHMSVAGNMSFGLKIRKVPTLMKDKEGNPVLKINKKLIGDHRKELKNLKDVLQEAENNGDTAKVEMYTKYIAEVEKKVEYFETTPVPVYVNRHIPKSEISKRVGEVASILQIDEYLERKPKALSGGQCQRVALGRAIVRNAKVFLMDEPLSNLDAKLRVQMRSEIVRLHNKLNATTIYVTHDQTEAMTMATRIVVMNKGYVQQIGTPAEIYNHPANLFVATFIGSPAMNLFEVVYKDNAIRFEDGTEFVLPSGFDKLIDDFYKNELASCEAELDKLDRDFVERNQILESIAELPHSGKTTEEIRVKKEELTQRLKQVEISNQKRVDLIDRINKYKAHDSSASRQVIFGIRPEDIYNANESVFEEDMTEPVEFEIQLAELMGSEYFIHTDFAGKDLVSKISTKKLLNSKDKIALSFDLSRAHIFDKVSQKLIK